MGYNNAIPQSSDPILQSQGQIQPNYAIIAQAFLTNHYPLTGNKEFQGMHRVLLMKKQTVDPVTTAAQIALYNKLDANSIPELFYAPASNLPIIQLTYSSLNTDMTSNSQYSFVAGPFVVYGGLVTAATVGQTITLTPTTNLLYVGLIAANVRGTPTPNDLTPVATSINSPMSTFTIQYQNVSGTAIIDVYYLAIGQP